MVLWLLAQGGSGAQAAGELDGAIHIGPGVKPPRALRKVKPEYSGDARIGRVQGTVVLQLAVTVGKEIEPELTGEYRAGDIRHCFADIALARETLGYEPQVALSDGMGELAAWLEGQVAVDRVEAAAAELKQRGLAI